jgi:preprotein translocase subunit SecA
VAGSQGWQTTTSLLVRLSLHDLNVRGKRYHAHERQALLDVLAPHSDVLLRLYGIDADHLVDELNKILTKLTRGLHDTIIDFIAFREETLVRLDQAITQATPETDFETIREEMFKDADLAAWRGKVTGELFGLGLFDVAKVTALPDALINELSWIPGEDTDFFAPGEFKGWPLRIWPIMRRPFISLNGRGYYFDIFGIFNNIYRVLRPLIIHHEPNYAESWNERQKVVTEALPFSYLAKLLPGATCYSPFYYRWKAGAAAAAWHEADGLLIYDDHLIIIEVKAGAFTYTSPASDLPAHLDSLRKLLEAPVRQGSRFVDYLESAPEVSIADADHREIARLKRGNFRHVTVCAVTLDAFTELAARAQHLEGVGIAVGSRGVWPLSLDDLRVYAEIFDNPLAFLHFIEQRVRAGQSKEVDLLGELDHLGLYMEQNNYSLLATELKQGNKMNKVSFDGYRTPIDEYFKALTHGDKAALLKQKMPATLADVLAFLAASGAPGRSELASFFLDASGELRDTLANSILTALRENKELLRARPLSLYGNMAATLYVWSPSAPRMAQEAIQHTRAVMNVNGEDDRRLIELEYAEDGTLIAAEMRHVTFSQVNAAELARIQKASGHLVKHRFEEAKAKGKIGRNVMCPCGSGKKFKRCHGR